MTRQAHDISAGLSARAFFGGFLLVSGRDGRLVPMSLHTVQARALDAWDALDPATGIPLYSELALLWLKKAGKTSSVAGLGLCELVAGREPDREVIFASSGLQQSKDVTFNAAVKFVRRHAWLSKHVRILSTELVYTQTVTDPRTGGKHRQDHVLRAVPTRNADALHGSNATLVNFDEFWSQSTYDAVEALASSPARRASRILYSSYAGLRSQMREGNPLFDLWQRWKAGTDPNLFVSYIGGPDGWKQIPWITEKFIDAQRRRFAAVPSKFKRLWQNEWSTDDVGSFLSGAEIHDAIDPSLFEPATGVPGIRYTIGVDLGISHDWTAVVVSHVAHDHKLVIDAVRFWRGTKAAPVSISRVEDELASLASRFTVERCILDVWQSRLLAERLQQRGIAFVETVAVDPSRHDRMATALKSVFASRLIRIPRHPELIEQLETIQGVEQKRRDLVRFTSGTGTGAGRHDDLVMALALTLESQAADVGRAVLPTTFAMCYRSSSVPTFSPGQCFLFKGNYVPSGDASCRACPGWQYTRQAYQDHVARGGERMDIRSFKRQHVLDNNYVARWHVREWADHNLW